MLDIKKFIDIENLRSEDVILNGEITRHRNDIKFRKGDKIQISTKVDGSNASVGYNSETDELDCFSRRMPLTGVDGLNGFVSKIRILEANGLKDILKKHKSFRVFGEWLNAPRTNKIKYNDDFINRWIIYSIYDTDKEEWLNQDIVKQFCEEAGLEYIEVLYEGPFEGWEHCKSFLHLSKYGDIQEGIVVRDLDRIVDPDVKFPHIIKIVNTEFAESMIKTKNPPDPEKEKAKDEAKALMGKICTLNRVEKVLGKLQEDGIIPKQLSEDNMRDVARVLPKAVYQDCLKEEPEVVISCKENAGKVIGSLTMAYARKLILG